MIIAALATILVLAIAYFQVVQGVFSALIMTIASVVCAVFALNAYPAVAEAFLYSRQGAYADAIALTALFVVPLLVVRLAMDMLIKGNVAFGMWADRIGGGVLGLITGMVLVGMLLIVMQMLPYGESILGFRPYDDAFQRNHRVTPFHPDEFMIGLAQAVSRGALESPSSFDKMHDDLLLEAFCARNTAGKNGAVLAKPDTLTVHRGYQPTPEQADWCERVPKSPQLAPEEATKILVLRCIVDDSAADADFFYRLPGTHFRLVARKARSAEGPKPDAGPADDIGDRPTEEEGPGQSYYPVGYLKLNKEGTKWDFAAPPVTKERQRLFAQLVFQRGKARRATVHWVYRIRQGEEPDYVVFRRVSRQPVSKVSKIAPPILRTEKPAGKTTGTKKKKSTSPKKAGKATKKPAPKTK